MALARGDPAPDFTLRTSYDVAVSLRPCLFHGSVVLEFLRGTWDPTSRERLALFSGARERFEELGARILAVTCEPAGEARRYLDRNPCPLAVLIDAERTVSRAYGAFQRFSFGAVNVARTASFVIDRCGFIRHSHIGRSPIDASPIPAIERVLEHLQAEAPGTGPGAARR